MTIIQACLVCPLAPRELPHLPSKTPSPPTQGSPRRSGGGPWRACRRVDTRLKLNPKGQGVRRGRRRERVARGKIGFRARADSRPETRAGEERKAGGGAGSTQSGPLTPYPVGRSLVIPDTPLFQRPPGPAEPRSHRASRSQETVRRGSDPGLRARLSRNGSYRRARDRGRAALPALATDRAGGVGAQPGDALRSWAAWPEGPPCPVATSEVFFPSSHPLVPFISGDGPQERKSDTSGQ